MLHIPAVPALAPKLEDTRKSSEKLIDTLKAVLEETDIRIADLKKEAYEFKRDIVVGAENMRTGSTMAEKVSGAVTGCRLCCCVRPRVWRTHCRCPLVCSYPWKCAEQKLGFDSCSCIWQRTFLGSARKCPLQRDRSVWSTYSPVWVPTSVVRRGSHVVCSALIRFPEIYEPN